MHQKDYIHDRNYISKILTLNKLCYNHFMKTNKIYSLDEIKKIINLNKEFLKKEYLVNNIMLFGSYAKNQQTSESDIDLLVDFINTIDMFKFIDLEEYLSKLFNKKVDLGTPNSLKDFIKNKILNEAITL